MQPYLFPYAGYFRLLDQADEFVIYDCVQFPRRGRVHRTEVPGHGGATEWLTLPLARQPRDTLIADLRFAPDARRSFDERLRRMRWLYAGRGSSADRVREFLHAPLLDVVDYLEAGLRLVCELVGISCAVSRSSWLGLDESLRGQERVLAIAAARGARVYVNAPGGVGLYDPSAFAARGMELRFLPPYAGPHAQLLHALVTLDPRAVTDDLRQEGPERRRFRQTLGPASDPAT